jgi:3D (Asp-Asp-Asp) domain-containing protein
MKYLLLTPLIFLLYAFPYTYRYEKKVCDYVPEVVRREKAIISAYSSTPDQTWGDPFITASGERVRDGVIANNCLPFGSEVEISGKTYIVLDRMNSRYSCEYYDLWMGTREEALQFGRQELLISFDS